MAHELQITQGDNWVELRRGYDAPKSLVFSMFKEADKLKSWWGPQTYPVTDCTIDFREGGSCLYAMTGPAGDKHWGKMVYEQIDEPNKIVFQDVFADATGTVDESLPTNRTTLTFVESAGVTTLTLRGEYANNAGLDEVIKMGMLDGMKETWQQLAERLQALQA